MKQLFLFSLFVFCCGLALGQKPAKAAAPVAPSPPVVTDTTIYLLPLEDHAKIRDFQHEYDQLEIENQKKLLEIEQNRARQTALLDAIKLRAFNFAEAQHLNLDLYDLDPAKIGFIRKKAKP